MNIGSLEGSVTLEGGKEASLFFDRNNGRNVKTGKKMQWMSVTLQRRAAS